MADYFIKTGYRPNLHPGIFQDSLEDSRLYQVPVYRRAAALAKELGVRNVLDIGCGLGTKLVEFVAPFCEDVTGIDLDESIEECRKRHRLGRWLVADLSDPGYELEGKYDLVIAADVIEHLIDPDRLLALIGSVSHSSTRAILSTPERDLRRGAHDMGPPGNPAHVREWNGIEFRRYVESRGFAVLESRIVDLKDGMPTAQMLVVSVAGGGGVKLLMTLLVRDEADIIEWNLRYHLSRGIDRFVVTDNRSTDGTTEILRHFERDGLLTYIYEPDDDYSQDAWVSRMACLAQDRFRPDWVLHCDADEFWWPDRAARLETVFQAIPADVLAIEVNRENFVGPGDPRAQPFFRRMVYRQKPSVNALGMPLPPKIAHRRLQDPRIDLGNHGVRDGEQRIVPVPNDAVTILHFPARTPKQFRSKIAAGGAAIKRNRDMTDEIGTWRSMHDDLIAGRFGAVEARHFIDPETDGPIEGLVKDRRLHDYLSNL